LHNYHRYCTTDLRERSSSSEDSSAATTDGSKAVSEAVTEAVREAVEQQQGADTDSGQQQRSWKNHDYELRHKLIYKNSPFHRIVPGFVIQGGALQSSIGNSSIYGKQECTNLQLTYSV
jgi:Cyclophilin type peptidyl-prolyl cis-trans isomerase/CLD